MAAQPEAGVGQVRNYARMPRCPAGRKVGAGGSGLEQGVAPGRGRPGNRSLQHPPTPSAGKIDAKGPPSYSRAVLRKSGSLHLASGGWLSHQEEPQAAALLGSALTVPLVRLTF